MQGRSCSTALKRRPHNLEVVYLKPTGGLAFSFFFLSFPAFLHQWSVLIQECISNCVLWKQFKKMTPSCAAWAETALISSAWVKKSYYRQDWLAYGGLGLQLQLQPATLRQHHEWGQRLGRHLLGHSRYKDPVLVNFTRNIPLMDSIVGY